MNKKDYKEYYIQGSDHYLIPREEFEEFEELFDRIGKAIEYINENMYELTARLDETSKFCKNGELDDLLKILKGEYNE